MARSEAQQEPAPAPAPGADAPGRGELIARAWEDGTLLLPLREDASPIRLPGLHRTVLPHSLSGPSRVELAGRGEHFAAWRVTPAEHPPVIVRVPHVPLAELPQPLSHEVAAMTLAPAGVGPEPIALEEDPRRSPIGHPYVATLEVPGTMLSPQQWTGEHLRAHARLLAQLHAVPAPGRGPIRLGRQPWDRMPAGPPSLLAEVEAEHARWLSRHAQVIAGAGLEPLLDAALEQVRRVEPEIAALEGFVLAHGDLCATNILWSAAPDGGDGQAEEGPHVAYIDFEWAQGDDPARDLAIIGGSVHGGPWYVPMDEQAVDDFVGAYVSARAEQGPLPGSVADTAALRRRMTAWTAYERTAMLVHVAQRAADAPESMYPQAMEQIRAGLTELLLGP